MDMQALKKLNYKCEKVDIECRKAHNSILYFVYESDVFLLIPRVELRYWTTEYKTTIYELHDPKVEYPDDIEW
ncbi:MAG: hypothetical protein HFJ08_11020 [Lachnospiraceae bacterium]|jgi:hypothetical protein|nr:hypothetical protein [Lachnospiraceae bacterium]